MYYLRYGIEFLDPGNIIDKLNFITGKKNSFTKGNIKRMRRQVTHWEKMFVKDTSDKGWLSKRENS